MNEEDRNHGDGWYRKKVSEDIWELHQQFTVDEGEDPECVAKEELLGGAGRAVFQRVAYEDGPGTWPWAVFRGSAHEIAAIVAKARGSKIGKPKREGH